MPLVKSSYSPSPWFKNGHWSTMYSAKLRRLAAPYDQRLRLELPDDDFLDMDLINNSESSKYCILLHGLEGNTERSYMKGAARALGRAGWNVVAVNYRGCSGEQNRQYYTYNAGKTDDLEFIIADIVSNKKPTKLALVGFSLGGNLLLKFLGSKRPGSEHVTKAVAVSAPLDLKATLTALTLNENWLYRTVFLRRLKSKLKEKAKQYPDKISNEMMRSIKTLLDFDNLYTAPAHGFIDADDYYTQNSCGQFLEGLKVPTLLVNAHNDSFLTPESYPFGFAKESEFLFLDTPDHGGHVGFVSKNGVYYSELKILDFLYD